MNILVYFSLIVLLVVSCIPQKQIDPLIIPLPHFLENQAGNFRLTDNTQIVVYDKELLPLAILIQFSEKRLLSNRVP